MKTVELVKVTSVKPVGGFKLLVHFSNGKAGEFDLSDDIAEGGPMVEPLRDPAIFARVRVEYGVPTWPNGFDIDAIRLYGDMQRQGLLKHSAGV